MQFCINLYTYRIKNQIHLFSSGSFLGMRFGSGSIGSCVGLIGVLMKASFLIALYRSERIFGYKSGILAKSSNGFSKSPRIIVTNFSGFVLNPKSSSFVLTKST